MATTSNDIANQALQLMGGNQPSLTGQYPNFGPPTEAAAKACNRLYGACVQTVGRQFEWDFARRTIALTVTGNVAPYPWALEYNYPTNGIEVWSLFPSAEADPNNPLPVNFVVANAIVGGSQARVIHANLANALAAYNNNPTETAWDASFREAVVRLLASELAMAIAGKPDVAQGALESYAGFEKIGEGRQD